MKIVEDSEFRYVEFNEKKSNLTVVFERENKEIVSNDEYSDKYVREYFGFTNLVKVEKSTITNKVKIGNTLISILNNKEKLQLIFQEYKESLLKLNSYQELKNTMIELGNKLKSINRNFTFFIYLLKCLLLELKIEKQPIKKSKISLSILLCDFIYQLEELEEIVNKLFIIPRNHYDNKVKMKELQLDISRTYLSHFILPESNNVYEIYKYYPRIIRTEYQISNVIDLAYSTIYHISQNKDSIGLCNYCNKYFLTLGKRNDAKNCCIECSNNSREKVARENREEYMKVYTRIAIYLKRHKKSDKFKTFRNRYLSKKEKFIELYGKGDKSNQKLLEWLLYYESKHIHK